MQPSLKVSWFWLLGGELLECWAGGLCLLVGGVVAAGSVFFVLAGVGGFV